MATSPRSQRLSGRRWEPNSRTSEPHISSRVHGSELRHHIRCCPGRCTVLEAAASLCLKRKRKNRQRDPSGKKQNPRAAVWCGAGRQYEADGSVERQSGPGDRSLGWDWSGDCSGTGPARHEGCRLRQECRQNRGGEFNLMRQTVVS